MNHRSSLNHNFLTIWSDVQQAYVAVGEHVKGKGKSKSSQSSVAATVMIATLGITGSLSALAAPQGGVIISGNGTISQNGTITTVEQSSQTLKADWQSFNINSNETVNFVQPNSTSLAVNTILDTNGSRIMGKLNANGQVWLINPNGIYFGQSATVNVGSILASTLKPLNGASNEGAQTFAGNSTAIVINAGNITAYGGYVALLSSTISANHGQINAENGAVAIASGTKIGAKFADNQLVTLVVEESTLKSLAENKQLIQADGGTVIMTAGAKDSLIASVVNNEGKIQAKTVQHKDGKIILMGGMKAGTTNVAGTIDASADAGQGDGGFIETSAANVKIADEANITTKSATGKTGDWLIDPTDFNIEAGNGSQTTSSIGADTLSSNLGSNNIQIQTQAAGTEAGDINVNAAVTWNAGTELKLTAHNDININQEITAQHATGKLALEYGQASVAAGNTSTYNVDAKVNLQAGDNFSTKRGTNGAVKEFKVITALGAAGSTTGTDLQGINGNLSGKYVLGSDIDASGTSTWNSNTGFDPLGDNSTKFQGTFDGLGHTVNDLTINRPSEDYVGLFGATNGATIQNLGVVGGSVTGRDGVGGLVGRNVTNSRIKNAYATGSVTGRDYVGGLVGMNQSSSRISNAYATGSVTGSAQYVGGLVGLNYSNSRISNAYATGVVAGKNRVGGLVGSNSGSTINIAYATGSVTGNAAGGLVGTNTGGSTINNSFWNTDTSNQATSAGGTGKTTAQMQQLATFTAGGWDIDDEGSTGKIWRIYEGQTSPLLRSFMTGLDLGTTTVTYNNNSQTAPRPAGADANLILGTGATGTNAGTYNTNYYSTQQGYDLSNGDLVIDQLIIDLTAEATAQNKVYDGNANATVNVFSNDILSGDNVTLGFISALFDNKNVGTNKTVTVSGISTGGADAGNYALQNTTATAQADITAKNITVAATADNKVYDGNTTAIVSALTSAGLIAGDSVSFSNTAANFDTKNVGTNKTVTVSGISTSGADAGNYALQNTTATAQADITAKNITVAATADNKVYDGNKTAIVNSLTSAGIIAGDTVSFSSTLAEFDTKNVGTSKVVTVTGISAAGADANNYSFAPSTITTADITAKNITVAATANNKVYDGNTTAIVNSLTSAGIISGDQVNFSHAAANFDTKNVGQNKPVTVTGINASGNDAGNYSFNPVAVTNADITAKHITLRAYASDKVYDGTTNAWLGTNVNGDPHFEHDGMVPGDNFWFSFSKASGQFSDKNVGNGKQVKFTGVTANGADKGNYTYDIQNVYSTASITPKHIEQTVYAHDKVYDDNNSASLAGYEAKGIVAGDQAWMVYDNANGWFDNKQVGTNKTVTFTGMQLIGADQGNYQFEPTVITSADIIQRQGYARAFLRNFKQYINAYLPEISAIILNEPKKMAYPQPLKQEEEQ